eukprot:7098383-Prymnesium_polylepis.1
MVGVTRGTQWASQGTAEAHLRADIAERHAQQRRVVVERAKLRHARADAPRWTDRPLPSE